MIMKDGWIANQRRKKKKKETTGNPEHSFNDKFEFKENERCLRQDRLTPHEQCKEERTRGNDCVASALHLAAIDITARF
jgi:hypothetical protein